MRREGHGQGLDHGHLDAQGPRARGHLGADEAGADDHQRPAPLEIRAERPGVVQPAQVVDVRRPPGAPGGAAPARRSRARGAASAMARPPTRARRPMGSTSSTRAPRRSSTSRSAQKAGGAQGQGVGVAGPGEQLLGERRAFVGRVRLVAGHEDPPAVASGPQRLCAAGAREARAHDEDVDLPPCSDDRFAVVVHHADRPHRAGAGGRHGGLGVGRSTRTTAMPSSPTAKVSGSRSTQAPKPLQTSRSMMMR